nr:peptidase inhibitor family I36 protein [Streptomyces sp. TLI_235]
MQPETAPPALRRQASRPTTSRPISPPRYSPTTAKGGSETDWVCPGGTFCAWDSPNAASNMIVEKDSACRLYDIGSAGLGDRISSYQNRTGVAVGLYNWDGKQWVLILSVADGKRGNLPGSADKQTDAVKVCDG